MLQPNDQEFLKQCVAVAAAVWASTANAWVLLQSMKNWFLHKWRSALIYQNLHHCSKLQILNAARLLTNPPVLTAIADAADI
jgi:hypothetical protein